MNNNVYNFATIVFLVVKHGGKAIYEHRIGFSPEQVSRNIHNFAKEAIERFKVNVRVYGLEDLIEGPAIMCPSHTSMVDMPSIAYVVPGRTYFVAKKELYKVPVLGMALRAIGMPKIDRSNREQAVKSLNDAAEMVKRESYGRKKEDTAYLMIYPEGTRTKDMGYKLSPFKKGAFNLSLDSGLPIIPVSSFGGLDLIPKGTCKFRNEGERNYYLKIHCPIFPKDFLYEPLSEENRKRAVDNVLEFTKLEIESGIKFLKGVSGAFC